MDQEPLNRRAGIRAIMAVVFFPTWSCAQRVTAPRSNLTEPALIMVRAMPSDSICQATACSAVLVDPWVRTQRSYETRLEPQRLESITVSPPRIAHGGTTSILIRQFSLERAVPDTLGPNTVGYRLVAPETGSRDTLRLYLQFFVTGVQHGESAATFISRDGTWTLVTFSIAII